jgi:two-component system, chemotaxis family, chemotaxis protein CheY
MKVLIVDDDADIRLLAGFLLRGAGHAVSEADDAASARDRFTLNRPDLVLMDVVLGDEDGVELAGELRGIDADARIVFLTGSTGQSEQDRMHAMSPTGVLHKPFEPAGFLTALDSILAPQ